MSTLTTTKGKTGSANVHTAVWDNLTTASNATVEAYAPPVSLAVGSVQVTGTAGGVTVTILGSNDGTNFVAIKDAGNSALSFTAAGIAELSSGFAYYKPNLSGGTGDDIDVTIAHWGK